MIEGLPTLDLVLGGDPTLYSTVRLSLFVSLSAVAIAAFFGMPLGAFLALVRFPGRTFLVVIVNAFMATRLLRIVAVSSPR